MTYVERRTLCFKTPGQQNTEVLLEFVGEYAKSTEIRDIVVASTTGETGVLASEVCRGSNLVVVTHHSGFRIPGGQELKEENKQKILKRGAKILTATHALSGAERAIRKRFGTIGPVETVANALRLFGEGTKVCVEIVLMAADAGLIPLDREVIAVAGSGRGADTALLMKPANSSRFLDLEVKEVIAKPRCLRKRD